MHWYVRCSRTGAPREQWRGVCGFMGKGDALRAARERARLGFAAAVLEVAGSSRYHGEFGRDAVIAEFPPDPPPCDGEYLVLATPDGRDDQPPLGDDAVVHRSRTLRTARHQARNFAAAGHLCEIVRYVDGERRILGRVV